MCAHISTFLSLSLRVCGTSQLQSHLIQPIVFAALIRPICLPLAPEIRSRDFVRHYPYIAGWGSIQFSEYQRRELPQDNAVQALLLLTLCPVADGPSSPRLLQLQIPVVSQAQCKDAFKKFSTAQIDDHVLCAGYAQGGKDACQVSDICW